MESSTYTDKKYIEASRMWVNVACHNETGHEVDAMIAGKKVTVCERYWNIPCDAHSKGSSAARGKYTGITGVPCTVYADPEGKELSREVGGKSASELIKIQEKVLEKVPGDHVSVVEWNQAAKLLADADAAFEKGEWKKAVEGYTRVSKLPKKVLKEKGTAGLDKLETKGRELITEAKEKIATDKEAARKLLRKVADDFKPLACAKEAAAALKEIPADEKK
ncbi:MAG TPA: hypothetical protein VGK61_03545 [Planctomycetota bacterium]|jgi:hypothetical protein